MGDQAKHIILIPTAYNMRAFIIASICLAAIACAELSPEGSMVTDDIKVPENSVSVTALAETEADIATSSKAKTSAGWGRRRRRRRLRCEEETLVQKADKAELVANKASAGWGRRRRRRRRYVHPCQGVWNERAAKERSHKHNERVGKERRNKHNERVAKERGHKERTNKERTAKERTNKERGNKERKNKNNERAAKERGQKEKKSKEHRSKTEKKAKKEKKTKEHAAKAKAHFARVHKAKFHHNHVTIECKRHAKNSVKSARNIHNHHSAVKKAVKEGRAICKKEKKRRAIAKEKRAKLAAKGPTFNFKSKPCKVGKGSFTKKMKQNERVTVGVIPANTNNVVVKLRTDKDVDAELWTANGKREIAIVAWMVGKINSPTKASIKYAGAQINYSGYNGITNKNGMNFGHEDIGIKGQCKVGFMMKAYAFQSGTARINYSWGSDPKKCAKAKAKKRKEAKAKHDAKNAMKHKMKEGKYKAALKVLSGGKGCKGAHKWTKNTKVRLSIAQAKHKANKKVEALCRAKKAMSHKYYKAMKHKEASFKKKHDKERHVKAAKRKCAGKAERANKSKKKHAQGSFNHYHGVWSKKLSARTKCRHLTRLANVGKNKCMAGAWLKKHKFFAWYPLGAHGVCWSSPICGVGLSGGALVKGLGATAYRN